MTKIWALAVLLVSSLCSAQLTILNIPSADVTDTGHIYARFDSTYNPHTQNFSSTPNFMFGIGKSTELNLNVNTLSYPFDQIVSVESGIKTGHVITRIGTPTAANFAITKKGEIVSNNGLEFFAGTKFANTVKNGPTSYSVFTYAATALVYGSSRFTSGFWNSQSYTGQANRSGAMLGYEYTINEYLVPAVDWSSGHGSNGYTTIGLMYYPTKRWMIIPSYQLGNTGVSAGNHQAVLYIGFAIK